MKSKIETNACDSRDADVALVNVDDDDTPEQIEIRRRAADASRGRLRAVRVIRRHDVNYEPREPDEARTDE